MVIPMRLKVLPISKNMNTLKRAAKENRFFEEDRKGMIKKGMLADFVILDTNPLKLTDVDAMREVVVLETIKEGNTNYKKDR